MDALSTRCEFTLILKTCCGHCQKGRMLSDAELKALPYYGIDGHRGNMTAVVQSAANTRRFSPTGVFKKT